MKCARCQPPGDWGSLASSTPGEEGRGEDGDGEREGGFQLNFWEVGGMQTTPAWGNGEEGGLLWAPLSGWPGGLQPEPPRG